VEDTDGGTLEVDAERHGDALTQGGLCSGTVQAHFAAEELLGRKAAKDDVGVRNCRFRTTTAIAHRAGLGTRTARTNVQRPAFVDPGDAAPARAHFDDVEDRDTNRQALI